MKKMLNTLFIMTEDAYLSLDAKMWLSTGTKKS